MKKPICTTCEVTFQVIKTGITVMEMYLDPPEPYRTWAADLLECPGCGTRIAAQFANKPCYEASDLDVDVVENERLDWKPTRFRFKLAASGAVIIETTVPCYMGWKVIGAIHEPESENPLLGLQAPFGVRETRRLLAEWEKWKP